MSAIKQIVVKVEGMTCNSCVANIERKVNKIDGVKSVKVSLENKKADVEFDGEKTNADAVVKTITDLGFEAKLY